RILHAISRALAKDIDAEPMGDGEEPAAYRAARLEPRDLLRDAGERLDVDVLGRLAVAQQAERVGLDVTTVPIDELDERGVVAPPERAKEIDIAGRGALHASSLAPTAPPPREERERR